MDQNPHHILPVIIYTDGSCHTQKRTGGWAAIVFTGNDKVILKGKELDTTHNRMELTAVIRAIEYAIEHFKGTQIEIYTDSQYVADLPTRKEKLKTKQFITKKGNELQNTDLLQQLINLMENFPVTFHKVKAHQKTPGIENINREVDIICRQIVRNATIGISEI